MWVPFIGISAVFLICFYPAWALVRAKKYTKLEAEYYVYKATIV